MNNKKNKKTKQQKKKIQLNQDIKISNICLKL